MFLFVVPKKKILKNDLAPPPQKSKYIMQMEPTPKFFPHRKMKLGRDIAHVETNKKIHYGPTLNPNRKSAILSRSVDQ